MTAAIPPIGAPWLSSPAFMPAISMTSAYAVNRRIDARLGALTVLSARTA